MSVVANTFVVGLWLAASQAAPTASQETWLKNFEGAWVVEGAVGADAAVVVNVSREGTALVLRVNVRDREIVTRYDLSGVDAVNESVGPKAIFRTRIDGEKLVTSIWDGSDSSGPPARIETRYLQSRDLMVTELVRAPSGQLFNRGVLRRKS